jgi:hypothetical protein
MLDETSYVISKSALLHSETRNIHTYAMFVHSQVIHRYNFLASIIF